MASTSTFQPQPKPDCYLVPQHQKQDDPLTIFPELVWVIILAKLKGSPEHLHALLQAYPSLRSYLHRPTWCFDVVIWNLYKYLSKSELLSCLHICSWWRLSVNRLLEIDGIYPPPIQNQYNRQLSFPNRWNAPFIQLRKCQDLLQFQEITASYSSHHNPFIGRAIAFKFKCNSNDTWRNFYNHVHSILEKFGCHLWHVTLPIFLSSKDSPDYSILYPAFLRCLSLLPNIRSLKLFDYLVRLAPSTRRNGITILEQVVQQNPVPDLAQLCSLDVSELLRGSQFNYDVHLESQKWKLHLAINPLLEKYLLSGSLHKVIIPSSLINIMNHVSTKFAGIRQVHLSCNYSGLSCKELSILKALEVKLGDQWPDLEELLIDSWDCRIHSLTQLWEALHFLRNLKSLWLYIENIESDSIRYILKNSFGRDILESSHDGILRNATMPWLKSLTIQLDYVKDYGLGKIRMDTIRALLERTKGLEFFKIMTLRENDYENERWTEGGLWTGLQVAWDILPKLKQLRIGNRVFHSP